MRKRTKVTTARLAWVAEIETRHKYGRDSLPYRDVCRRNDRIQKALFPDAYKTTRPRS